MRQNILLVIKKFIVVFLVHMGIFATIVSGYVIFKIVPPAKYMEELNYEVVVEIFKHTKVYLIALILIFVVSSIWYVMTDLHFENKKRKLGLNIDNDAER